MDKKKKLKHIGNKAKEESTMEKKKNHKSKNIHEILPVELIHRILLQVPIRHLARLRLPYGFRLPYSARLYGFGYDASRDDYLVVVAWIEWERRDHLDCLSLRTNSWINLDVALPESLRVFEYPSCGLFLNGAIHWVPFPVKAYSDAILIFDLKERTFSTISAPEHLPCSYPGLALLGGCLALYYYNNDSDKTEIWVMKEYKVHSSWTLYQIPCGNFRPLCLSNNGDIIGEQFILDKEEKKKFLIYNVGGQLLPRVKYPCFVHNISVTDAMYTESLLTLPSDIKDNKKKKRKTNIKFTIKFSITKDPNKERR
ncbi:F-box/kelch-repeat protein At3g06240-like [Arachis ipaensis]|uniref:F-box/kelch-repeat protein At3g06240-like n=1 Tax=Arachis ipaensis TaxID=130454 RepID=UPI0007AFA33E|nr:F-box/kelch-repeat protein At3g06240-like [Arachis ipaensis]